MSTRDLILGALMVLFIFMEIIGVRIDERLEEWARGGRP